MNCIEKEKKYRRHWLKLYIRIFLLYLKQSELSSNLINKNYNKIADDYDQNWTYYIHDLSEKMLNHLPILEDADALDLTCGTGFITGKLAKLTNGKIVGVDASKGMLDIARENHGENCTFINSDLMSFLKSQPSNSIDVVTCGWGLGYFSPLEILKEVSRILKPNGIVGIIDHSRLSNLDIVRSAFYAFAEKPDILKHKMKTYYLKNSRSLSIRMKLCNFDVLERWDEMKTFYEQDARTVINRLTKTGAAVGGIDFATDDNDREIFYNRLAEIIQDRCWNKKGIPIKYRCYVAIARK